MIPRHQGSEPSIWQIAGLQDQLHRAADRLRSSSDETAYRTWLLGLRDGSSRAAGASAPPCAVTQLGHYLDELGDLMGKPARRQMLEGLLRDCDSRASVAV